MVTPLARRRPWIVARQAVALDQLSGGRFVLGLGLGLDSSGGELSRFGEETDDRRRAGMLDEGLEVLTRLLAGEHVDHRGEHYTVEDVTFLPTPVRAGRHPDLAGGALAEPSPGRPGVAPRRPVHDRHRRSGRPGRHRRRGPGAGPAVRHRRHRRVRRPEPAAWAAAGATWWLAGFDVFESYGRRRRGRDRRRPADWTPRAASPAAALPPAGPPRGRRAVGQSGRRRPGGPDVRPRDRGDHRRGGRRAAQPARQAQRPRRRHVRSPWSTPPRLARDPSVRAVVLSGEGRAFSAGLDFSGFMAMAGRPGHGRHGGAVRTAPAAGDRAGADLGAIGRTDGRITHLAQQAAHGWSEVPVPVDRRGAGATASVAACRSRWAPTCASSTPRPSCRCSRSGGACRPT